MRDNIHLTELVSTINAVIDVLNEGDHIAQIDVLVGLIDSLERAEFEKFIKDINGPDLWGGSGAVWEVEMPDSASRARLNRSLIALLTQMSSKKILGKRAKSIYSILRNT